MQVVREGESAEPAVAPQGVDAAQAPRGKLRPGDHLLHLGRTADLGRHDAAGASLQRPHHRGVVGGGQANERVQTLGPGRQHGLLDLADAQAGVLLVEPDGIEAANQADQLHQLGIAQLAHAKHAKQSSLGQRLLES